MRINSFCSHTTWLLFVVGIMIDADGNTFKFVIIKYPQKNFLSPMRNPSGRNVSVHERTVTISQNRPTNCDSITDSPNKGGS
jgi:hypothetical protein